MPKHERIITSPPPEEEGGDPESGRLHTYVVSDEPAPEPVYVAVEVVERKGQVALVEWQTGDSLHRAYIPASELTPRGVTAEVLAAGEPYGLRWESLIEVPTPAEFARALRQQGIWTRDELAMRLGDASQVGMRVVLESMRRVIRATKE